jgi:UDP-N-acetylglucosamine--dolichyl-phosphate N-acetylglucosaminephosphotransferase
MAYSTYLTLIVPAIITFFVTVGSTKFVIDYLFGAGVVAEDHNKAKPVLLPSSGGLAVVFGIIVGALTYAFGGSFKLFVPVLSISNLLAVSLSIVLIAMIGFLDDINVKAQRVRQTGGYLDRKQGLKKWQKPLLTLVGALPLLAINAGVSTVNVPFIGPVALGLIYPLLILPLAVVFVSNAFNLLGGFDGLQPGMALIASMGFMAYFFFFGSSVGAAAYTGALLSVVLFAALLAFLPFNKFPAKIIPGDSFTYAIGAILVAIMAMGNAESFGVIIFIPWIVEFFLHLRRRFDVRDLGIRQKDGTLKAPYGKKIYSLAHVVMNARPVTERGVTLYLCVTEATFVLLALILKAHGLL